MRYIKLLIEQSDLDRRKLRADGDPSAQSALCGDKEIMLYAVGISPKLSSGLDQAKFFRIERKINDTVDPGWLMLEEEEWNWLKDKLNHDKYGAVHKDSLGNELPMFPLSLKRSIGYLVDKLEKATNEMPSDLKDEIMKKEAQASNVTPIN